MEQIMDITLEGSGCDKSNRNCKLCKSQPPFDVRRQYLDVFDRFTGWSCEISLSNFSLFRLFFKIYPIVIGFIFYELPAGNRLSCIWSHLKATFPN